MGFNWEQSSKALKAHASLEEAVEALFAADTQLHPEGKSYKVFLKVRKMIFFFLVW